MNSTFLKTAGVLALAALTMPVMAQNEPGFDPALDQAIAEIELPPRYQVEVIVFMNLRPTPGNESFTPRSDPFSWEEFDSEDDEELLEIESEEALLPLEDDQAGEAEEEIIRRRPTEIITDTTEWNLEGISQRIKTSRDYRLLSHQVWQQDGLAVDVADPYVLRTPNIEDGTLNGTVMLSIGRFPHLKLDLDWLPDGDRNQQRDLPLYPGLDDLRNMPTPYQIKQSRRITRTGEAHYFDHPYFGAIAVVSVVEEPEIDESGATSMESP